MKKKTTVADKCGKIDRCKYGEKCPRSYNPSFGYLCYERGCASSHKKKHSRTK